MRSPGLCPGGGTTAHRRRHPRRSDPEDDRGWAPPRGPTAEPQRPSLPTTSISHRPDTWASPRCASAPRWPGDGAEWMGGPERAPRSSSGSPSIRWGQGPPTNEHHARPPLLPPGAVAAGDPRPGRLRMVLPKPASDPPPRMVAGAQADGPVRAGAARRAFWRPPEGRVCVAVLRSATKPRPYCAAVKPQQPGSLLRRAPGPLGRAGRRRQRSERWR